MSSLFTRQDEPLMNVQATPSEIIVLKTAIEHHIWNLRFLQDPDNKDTLLLLERLQQRLIEALQSNQPQKEASNEYTANPHAISQDHRTT